MKTLTIEQAAELLHMHVVTLRNKARTGEIPAAKAGKRWLFLEVDLTNWFRLQYSPQALQGDELARTTLRQSTNVKIAACGLLSSASMDDEYRKVLGLTTGKPLKTNSLVEG